VNPFAHSFRIALGSNKGNLLRESSDVAGQGKQLVREGLGETVKVGVIAILRVVRSAEGCRLGLKGVEAIERHDDASSKRWVMEREDKRIQVCEVVGLV
jgi:hypothetical protein